MSFANPFPKQSNSRSAKVLFTASLMAVILHCAIRTEAAVVTWTGGSASGNWSAGANWDSGSAPANNDSLVFNAAVGAGSITNNLSNRTFAQISFIGVGSSYFVYGNPIILTGGISQSSSGGANTIHTDLTLATNDQTFSVSGAGIGSGLQITGDINLNGRNLTVNVTDAGTELTLSGIVSGSGTLTRGTGAGGLRLSGSSANTYDGATIINGGYLFAVKPNGVTAIPGDVVVGNGVGVDTLLLGADNQLAATSDVTIRDGGVLDNNNETNLVRNVTFDDGGLIDMTTGRLELGGTVSVIGSGVSNSIINGNLHLGSATRTFNIANTAQASDLIVNAVISGGASDFLFPSGLIKSGAGVMRLNAANTYSGATTVNEGQLVVADDLGLGSAFSIFGSAGTIVNSNAVLVLNNAHVTNEVLTLNSTNPNGALQNNLTADWIGRIVLNTNVVIEASSAFGIDGPITGPGGFTKVGVGTLTFFGDTTNTYAGTTTVAIGTLLLDKTGANRAIPGPLVIGDNTGGVNADVVRLARPNQIENTAAVTITGSGLYDMDGNGDAIGSLAGSGNVVLGNATMNIGFNDTSTNFSGIISGTGGINKFSGTTGTQTFSGDNTYTGTTTINGGTLLVNGQQPQSSVLLGENGTLGGRGRVGVIQNSAGGIVSPGTSPGVLTSSNVVFGVDSDFNIEINGPAFGTGYDRLAVIGTNSLNGALNVTVGGGFVPTEGQEFSIIVNDGVELVTGTFAGLPNNSIVSFGLHKFRINYGNDVVLTYTNPPLDILVPQLTSGNGNGSIDPNECNSLNLVITNVAGVPLTGISAILSADTPGVVITQPESAYPDLEIDGRGTNTTPFQISTLPSFNCSDAVELKLTLKTASGDFASIVSLPSGFTGNPVRFNNNVNLATVDSGSITSSIAVAGITTPVKKVTVSLHLSHASDEDLDISLLGPDGTIINLSSDNGGTGDDYGTDCVDGSRTVFDDSAASAITSGVAPFVGAFRPEQQLSAFIGKEGLDVNGTWKLIVRDDAAGSLGTLRCWSLFISPTACSAGGGACETCPGVFTGSITNTDALQAGRLTRDGLVGSCDVPKACPGLEDPTPRNYDVYNFTNSSGSAQCVYISLTVNDPANQTFCAAYLGSFNPADLCANHLGDTGFSTSGSSLSYSITVPAGNAFAVTVNEITPGSGCTNYTLVVSGVECPPALAIESAPANRVRLHWPTTAGGYTLQANPVLTSTNWTPVTNEPVVVDGRFSVTNSAVDPTNRFYRLEKP